MHSSEQWAELSCASHHSTAIPIITANHVDLSIIAKLYHVWDSGICKKKSIKVIMAFAKKKVSGC